MRERTRQLTAAVSRWRAKVRARFTIWVRSGSRGPPITGALVRFAGRHAHTARNGRARLTATLHRRIHYPVAATKAGYAPFVA